MLFYNYPADVTITDGSNPAFAGKTVDLCAAGDPICSQGIRSLRWAAHLQNSYISSGLVDQAASFVAGKL
ncbi:cutinase family protein [Candidatus Mycobacterium methanotrophicum]|uniref:Cutinase family protein n=1 Tax=Candidatus Mycobacterium methanotrophicum TaxID=2943498 RepID=A0ABY4QIV9_9MYCO|nr:cutinase family protein [Candidatus Mycobacterium methanotrophicum]UQX10511.1 cutinase family protein [Candidatus Mycobacterium methanotrophicum]